MYYIETLYRKKNHLYLKSSSEYADSQSYVEITERFLQETCEIVC